MSFNYLKAKIQFFCLYTVLYSTRPGIILAQLAFRTYGRSADFLPRLRRDIHGSAWGRVSSVFGPAWFPRNRRQNEDTESGLVRGKHASFVSRERPRRQGRPGSDGCCRRLLTLPAPAPCARCSSAAAGPALLASFRTKGSATSGSQRTSTRGRPP